MVESNSDYEIANSLKKSMEVLIGKPLKDIDDVFFYDKCLKQEWELYFGHEIENGKTVNGITFIEKQTLE